MKIYSKITAFVLALLLAFSFIGCGGGGDNGGSSNPLTGGGNAFNFFVQPVSDAIAASGQAIGATALALINSVKDFVIGSGQENQSKKVSVTPLGIGASQVQTVDITSALFNDCQDLVGRFPMGREAGWLPLWYADRVTDGSYNLAKMADYSLTFLRDIHCHGDKYFNFSDLGDDSSGKETQNLNDPKFGLGQTYAEYTDNGISLAWKEGTGDLPFQGSMRVDSTVCIFGDETNIWPTLFPGSSGSSAYCEKPAPNISTADGHGDEQTYKNTVQHLVYKEEKKDGEERLVQLVSKFVNLVNVNISGTNSYCKHVTTSFQESTRDANNNITIYGYTTTDVTEDDASNCSISLLNAGKTNTATILQKFHLIQNDSGTTVYYQCTNDYVYDYSSDNGWENYYGWCSEADPSGTGSYDSGVKMTVLDTNGYVTTDVTDDTTSYTFPMDEAPITVDDSNFAVDGVSASSKLW